MSFPVKKGGSLDKWIVRKHGKIKKVIPPSIKTFNNIKHSFTKQQFDQRIQLRRHQQQRTQQLTLHGTKIVHNDLNEYGHPYSFSLLRKVQMKQYEYIRTISTICHFMHLMSQINSLLTN